MLVQFDHGAWHPAVPSNTTPGLFTLPWDPSHFHPFTTSHILTVSVTDTAGRTKAVVQPFLGFSRDMSRPMFGLQSRLYLMTDVVSILQVRILLQSAWCSC